MREHGTRACYVFGTEPGSDRANGCRCLPCMDANRAYARARLRRLHDGEPAYVDATETREWLRELARRGVGSRAVARAARLERKTVLELRDGITKRCRPDTADRIACVFPAVDAADAARIDAAPTMRLVRDLVNAGYTRATIARLLGSTAKASHPGLQIGRRGQVSARTARNVRAIHARLMPQLIAEREMQARRRQHYRNQRQEHAA